jgi:hypothetical protein
MIGAFDSTVDHCHFYLMLYYFLKSWVLGLLSTMHNIVMQKNPVFPESVKIFLINDAHSTVLEQYSIMEKILSLSVCFLSRNR